MTDTNEKERKQEKNYRKGVVKPAPKIEEKRYQRLRNKTLRGGNLQHIT